jgi:TfoX/Sxy family transcriptional regulator of competence genes
LAYDEGLAERIRDLLEGRRDVTEKAMFGGLAFLVPKGMFVGITGHDLMARVGPEAHAECLRLPHVRPMDFTGRPIKSYVFVSPEGTSRDADLAAFVTRSLTFVDTLPAKKTGPRAKPRKR